MSPRVIPPAEKQRRPLHPPLASGGWAGRHGAGCIARIWLEYSECYLSEIIWASKPYCGISTMQKAMDEVIRQKIAQAVPIWRKH